jgi:hypothetical protein
MINTKLQNIIDTKSAIGNAIVNKGGTITSETPFYEYAPAIENISTGGGAYSTWIAQAQDNSLYTVYNGYDSLTNPTPNLSNNFAFNRWLLNNSATGDIVLSNVVVANGGTFNGPNITFDENNLAKIGNTPIFGGTILKIITNNGSIFASGGFTANNNVVRKYNEAGLFNEVSSVTLSYAISALALNNGFVYGGGDGGSGFVRWFESNLVNNGISSSYNGTFVRALNVANGFIYAAGPNNISLQKFNETTMQRVGVSYNLTYQPVDIKTAEDNVFVADGLRVHKIRQSDLAALGTTANYGGDVRSIAVNNGFLYVGGGFGTSGNVVKKYHQSNLTFIGQTTSYGNQIEAITFNNGFLYVAGNGRLATSIGYDVKKYYETNLAFVANSVNYGGTVRAITANNGFIYFGGFNGSGIHDIIKIQEKQTLPEILTFYNITNIKE